MAEKFQDYTIQSSIFVGEQVGHSYSSILKGEDITLKNPKVIETLEKRPEVKEIKGLHMKILLAERRSIDIIKTTVKLKLE